MPPRLSSSMISNPATTCPGWADGAPDEPGCEPDDEPAASGPGCELDSWAAVWASSAQIGQISRKSDGIGSAWGCSQTWPSGQVRRTVVMESSGRDAPAMTMMTTFLLHHRDASRTRIQHGFARGVTAGMRQMEGWCLKCDDGAGHVRVSQGRHSPILAPLALWAITRRPA